MPSSSGSASVAPRPRRNVRRGRCFSGDDHDSRRPPHLERHAVDDAERAAPTSGNQRTPRLRTMLADGRRVVVLEAAAERVRQQLLGHRLTRIARVDPRAARGPRPGPSNVAPSGSARRTRRSARRRRACATCRWRRSSRARARADPSARGSSRTPDSRDAARAARGPDGAAAGSSLSSAPGTFGGGGGGGVPSRFSSTHLPRSVGDVRFGYDVTVRMLPCPRSPPRAVPSSDTRRKWLP